MRHTSFVLLILISLSFFTCNDGDIITVELEFDDEFSQCGETDLVFYKTIDDPSQSLSVLIEDLTFDELLEVDDDNTLTLEESGTLNYRQYSNDDLTADDLFCNDVPPSDVIITDDDESDVEVTISTTLTEDDNDGVSTDIEGTTNDTDGDGILDYLDQDDDGDNVLTEDENPDPDGDGDVSDAQDTDNDGIPDYLDDDDDGDGVLTRDEENESMDQNPGNDISDLNAGADYLNPDINSTVEATAYRAHTVYQTYEVIVTLTDVSLSDIYYETLSFGSLDDSDLTPTRTETPDFP